MHRAVGASSSSLASPTPVIWSAWPCESSFGVDLENHGLSVISQCSARLPPPHLGSTRPYLFISVAVKDAHQILGLPLGSTKLNNVASTTQYIPDVSPKFGGNQSGRCGVLCPETVFLGVWIMDEGVWLVGRDFRRMIELLVCCWLVLWPGDLLDQAGLFTGYCLLRAFFNSFSDGKMILRDLSFQNVSRMGQVTPQPITRFSYLKSKIILERERCQVQRP